MSRRNRVQGAMAAVVLLVWSFGTDGIAQSKTAAARVCAARFGSASRPAGRRGAAGCDAIALDAVADLRPISTDEGTAGQERIRRCEIVARLSGGYLHFIQSFRTGPLYDDRVRPGNERRKAQGRALTP
jgi:hypothetical protein